MKLHELQPSPGSHHARKRVGRGPGSGHGKTATRGQKGQGARTSVNLPKTFEGGQTRLTMRIPKLRGFHNKWRKRFAVLNLTRLNRFKDGTEIRPESLLEAGIIKDVGAGIKVLGTGDLRRKLTIHAHQLQGVRGADTVRSLAQHWLALRTAADGYVAVRITIRDEFVAKQPIVDNRQQVQRQPGR